MDNSLIISIIKNAEDTLQTAIYGLEEVKSSSGQKKFAGIRNFVVFGRSVTFVLQNLRGKVSGFDEWYDKHQERMKNDNVMRYFLELRNTILKVGTLRTGVHVSLNTTSDELFKSAPRPPGAKHMFVGDPYGGSGWLIDMPDGTQEKFYVDLPKSLADVKSYFLDVPEKLREEIQSKDVIELGDEYISKLKDIIDDCRKTFLGEKAPTYGAEKKRLPPYIRVIK